MSDTDQVIKADFELEVEGQPPVRGKNRARNQSNTCRMRTSVEDIQSLTFWKAQFAEFVGTFLLVLVGVGSCIQSWSPDELDVVQIALSFGLAVATCVWIVGQVSGGHINPAVTIAMFITRKISCVRAIVYIIVQCLGSIAAAGLLKALTPEAKRGPLGCTSLGEGVEEGQGFVIELFLTMLLVLTVFASCDKNRKDLAGSFPLAIGLSVTVGHLWAVEFTGSSMNPARSLGPAVVMDKWDDHWVYWAGPMTGGLLAGLLYDNLLAANASLLKARSCLMNADFDDDRYRARKKKVIVLEEEEEEPGEDKTFDTNRV